MSWGGTGCGGEVCRDSMHHRGLCGWMVSCSALCPGVSSGLEGD